MFHDPGGGFGMRLAGVFGAAYLGWDSFTVLTVILVSNSIFSFGFVFWILMLNSSFNFCFAFLSTLESCL